MKYSSRLLPSGLTLQSISVPGSASVTALVLVQGGSRLEEARTSGVAHFLEHMFFKGGKRFPTPKSVVEAVDQFGGQFNAFTGKEYAGYYIKAGRDFLDQSLAVLSDMLLEATIDPQEIEKERGVILEEYAMYQDAPMYQISWDFERGLYGDQPLGWDQIGTKETISSLSREDLAQFRSRYYRPERMVITLSGAVTEDDMDKVASLFDRSVPEESVPAQAPLFSGVSSDPPLHQREKQTEQYHLSLGYPTFGEKDPRYPALVVLKTILGGNMSSRMFQELREQQGYCYSIRTYSDGYTDTGFITTQAGLRLDALEPAIKGLLEQYDRIASRTVAPQELQNAQQYLCGKLDLEQEDSYSVAHDYAKDQLLYGKIETYEDWKERLRSVSADQVQALAQEIFVPSQAHLALIGPPTDLPGSLLP